MSNTLSITAKVTGESVRKQAAENESSQRPKRATTGRKRQRSKSPRKKSKRINRQHGYASDDSYSVYSDDLPTQIAKERSMMGKDHK